MKKRFLTLIIALLFCSFLGACTSHPDAQDINGKSIRFKHFLGKWVVLNYWAAWCKPCIVEIPQLNKLAQQYKNKVVVMGINYDQLPITKQQQLAQKLHIDYILLQGNPGEKLGIEASGVIPATYLINPQGKLQDALLGPQSEKSLVSAMQLTGDR